MKPSAAGCSAVAEGLRLNLGGRDTVIPGFKTVDLRKGPSVDLVADIADLKMIDTGTVDEIYASHCLEHFTHVKTAAVLREWRRVLRPGASCWISVPDFEAAVRLFQKEGMTDFIVNLLWGDQGYGLAYHYAGFTFPRLAALLALAGFEDVKRQKWMPHKIADCSRLVDTATLQPISLTVEAIA